ncbi:MAG: M20/M25/M40 family metallo-hydrolase, partial [Pseudomonadota bacterium]
EAGGTPYLFGELDVAGAAGTLLLYAHYDGQPVSESDWSYPPFSPTLVDGRTPDGAVIDVASVSGGFGSEWRLYARSAADDKLPIMALVHAIDAVRAQGLRPSVNIKVLFDGEEERGSPTIGPLLERYAGLAESDLILFCDGPMHPSRQLQLVFGVRGHVGLELTVYGASRPVHSGHFGNWAPNPAMQLAHLLAGMRSAAGDITIEGFGKGIRALTNPELDAIRNSPDLGAQLQDELAIHTPEGGGTRLEELLAKPAMNIRGISAGAVGGAARNAIPDSATASIDFRLVPDQKPEHVRKAVSAHVSARGFHIVDEEPSESILRRHSKVAKLGWGSVGYPALRTSAEEATVRRLTDVLNRHFGRVILTPTMGGSLPLYEFGSRLDTPIVILPLANHDNNQHAADENLRLQNLWDAIEILGTVLSEY